MNLSPPGANAELDYEAMSRGELEYTYKAIRRVSKTAHLLTRLVYEARDNAASGDAAYFDAAIGWLDNLLADIQPAVDRINDAMDERES